MPESVGHGTDQFDPQNEGPSPRAASDHARADRQRCRHRLGKFLLRRGLHYPDRAWTQAHRRWNNGLRWPHAADRVVVDDYLLAIDHLKAKLMMMGLDAQLVALGERRSVSGCWRYSRSALHYVQLDILITLR